MPFATYVDVQARLGRPLSAEEQAAATAAIAEAENAIQVYTGQRFTPGTDTQNIVSVTGSVMLVQNPVTALTGYRIAGQTQPLDSLTLTGNVVSYLPVGVPIEIDYTYGYATLPEAIKGITVRSALRAMTNPTSVSSYTIGGYTETRDSNSEQASSVLGVSDITILNRYRLPLGRTMFVCTGEYRYDPSRSFQGNYP